MGTARLGLRVGADGGLIDEFLVQQEAVLGVGRSGSVVLLNEGEIRFVEATDGRGEGVSGLEFRSDRSTDLEIGGVRMALRPQ